MTRPRPFFAGCLCLVLIAFVGAAPATQPSDAEKENAELRKRVAALEAQVKSLEDQVAKLKQRQGAFPIPRWPQAPQVPAVPTPPMPPTPRTPQMPQMPGMPYRFDRLAPAPDAGRDWIPREFNGGTVYLVPCTPAVDVAAPSK